ncbi:MAG: exosortase-associated EpsI family protein [Halobacteriota archaeon]|nr:exosortase-associated EpsI family protein [Halobacteriota archaeon]
MFRTAETARRNLLSIVGIILLAYVLIGLLAPEGIADYTVVDTSYWRETENRLILKTSYEYNNKTEIERFPTTLGEWNGYNFRYPGSVYETLEADILLSRAYTKEGYLVWLDIINSRSGKSFHDPKVCYSGRWDILNESIEDFQVTGNKSYLTFYKVHTNKLELRNKDDPSERQVVFYWFMFKSFDDDQGVTMIRLSAPVRINETETFETMKRFLEDELFDAMYESEAAREKTVAEGIIDRYDSIGILLIVLLITAPIVMIFYGDKFIKL